MRNYSLLSDHDFELLVADLFRADKGGVWEAFARGADRGVDLRRIHSAEVVGVAQCKHMLNSTYAQLKAKCKKEAGNLQELDPQPSRYYLVTTQQVTQANKDELKDILEPWVSTPDDILGAEDLEGLLNLYPNVERSHTKLWISGAGQLDAQLHAATWVRSKQLLNDLRAALPRYVEISAFDDAHKRLHDEHVLVISGPPGIGKTTLARLLLADAANEDFEPIEVSEDIEEANAVFRMERRQIFYYDDFLGSNFLTAGLTKNEDKRLAAFMRRCAEVKGKRFVLTTREHILQQAVSLYDELDHVGVPVHKFLLQLSSYSRYERARIFYNHIWHSGQLNASARQALLASRNYMDIIDHPNYNPRLIEYITGLASHRLDDVDKEDYVGFAINILDHPDEIWKRAFNHQLDGDCRDVLIALTSLNGSALSEDLSDAFFEVARARGSKPGHGAYRSALRVLDDSFTRSRVRWERIFIDFANPSISDFVTAWLMENPESAVSAAESAIFFEQAVWLDRMLYSGLSPEVQPRFDLAVAAAADRCWRSKNPSWRHSLLDFPLPLAEAREPESSEERLQVISSLLDRSQAAASMLEDSFARRLEEVRSSWSRARPSDPYQPSRLIYLLNMHGRLDVATFNAAVDVLEREYDDQFKWDQLRDLHKISPDWFGHDRFEDTKRSFSEWLAYVLVDGLDDLAGPGDLYGIEDLADYLGLPVDELLWDSARDALRRREADETDEDESDYGGVSDALGRAHKHRAVTIAVSETTLAIELGDRDTRIVRRTPPGPCVHQVPPAADRYLKLRGQVSRIR